MEIQSRPQIFDVDEQNFEELVLQGSLERVIVVDFLGPLVRPLQDLRTHPRRRRHSTRPRRGPSQDQCR